MPEQGDVSIYHAFNKAVGKEPQPIAPLQPEKLLRPDLPVFHELLSELRLEGVPTGTTEFLDLQKILEAGVVNSLEDLYPTARAVMVKDVTFYDTYDIVFARLFGKYLPKAPPDSVSSSTGKLAVKEIDAVTDEDVKPEVKEEPKKENQSQEVGQLGSTEESHGGDDAHKAIKGSLASAKDGEGVSKKARKDNVGIGGEKKQKLKKSKGHGKNGHTVRKTLEEKLLLHEFQPFDKNEIINQTQFERVLARLTTIIKQSTDEPTKHLDMAATVNRIAQNGGLPELVYSEEEETKPSLLILFDTGGSTDPHIPIIRSLFSAASEVINDLEIHYFHNAVYGELLAYPNSYRGDKDCIPIESILRKERDLKVIIIGDAQMAYEGDQNGGLHDRAEDFFPDLKGGYYSRSGYQNFQAIRNRFPSTVWINPLRETERAASIEYDEEYGNNPSTVRELQDLFPTYELTLNGLEKAVQQLMVEQ